MSETNTEAERVRRIAERHGFGEAAGRAMARAMTAGGGGMAQFDHPELGGMGQWTRGGMLMIGAMGDDGLKARVRALADELAEAGVEPGRSPDEARDLSGFRDAGRWWPDGLGTPSSSGGQNGWRYAVFPDRRRLAVERDGGVAIHDTGDHRIGGVSQQQGARSTLAFTSQHGDVRLEDLPEVRNP